MDPTNPYLLLAVMHASGVLAFILDRIGHGRVEDEPGLRANVLMLLTWPLLVISGAGVVAGTIWAAIALSFWSVLGIALLAHLAWGGVCWYVMGWLRVNGSEHVVHAVGIPLVFALRLASAVAAVLLFLTLWRGVE
jgi:hypothetical protein